MKLRPKAELPREANCAECGTGPCAYYRNRITRDTCAVPKTISRADQSMIDMRELAEKMR